MFKGNVVSQILGVIGALVLAKLYGPEHYGIYAVYIGLASIFSILFTLQLDLGIVTSITSKLAKYLASSLIRLSFLILVLGLIVITVLNNTIDFNFPFEIIYLAFIGGWLMANNKIQEYLLTKNDQFKYISRGKFILTFLIISIQAILFKINPTYGLVIGTFTATLGLLFYYIKKNISHWTPLNIKALKKSIAHHQNLWRYALPSNLINALAINILPLLIVTFFGKAISGNYSMAFKILATPLLLISSSISNVYYQKATKFYFKSKEKLYRFTYKIVIQNLLLYSTILIAINTIGLYLIELFFDEKWLFLPKFVLLLSFLFICRCTFTPISHILTIIHKNHISLLFNLYLLIVNILAIYIGYYHNNIDFTIVTLSLLGGAGYLLVLIYSLRLIKTFKR